ncbi:Flp1 family type IVb pilin [Gracilibacillus massiliensis]|uniref:Flp1 family type IVb pilin n=1 Tax=Gracilibacillus massiliensis TaxID=1564956 RepID=UPI00097C3FFA|nr:Flp1 family type IVb pilin [Gracilibacillus massiliensis]
MKQFIANLWTNEEGLGTLELLLIIAVLVGVAILFGNTIIEWVEEIIDGIDVTPPQP